MRMTTLALAALALTTLGATGCDTQKEDEVTMLRQEATELRAQLDERDKALEAANGELRQVNLMLRDQKEQYETEMQSMAASAVPAGGFDNIEGVTATYGPNDVTVAVEGDVLFDSGRTTLKSNAKRSLDRVADVINSQYGGKPIIVAGHTDTDPIRKSGHKSNHHLGFERGWAVRSYLLSRGVDSSRIAVMSYGPDRPMGSSQKSRRVEIVVAQ